VIENYDQSVTKPVEITFYDKQSTDHAFIVTELHELKILVFC